jgi:hypothetical protein
MVGRGHGGAVRLGPRIEGARAGRENGSSRRRDDGRELVQKSAVHRADVPYDVRNHVAPLDLAGSIIQERR